MIHHSTGCLKCARGEGHPLWVLTVGYPGGKTRQVSVRPEQVPLVRKAIEEYRDVKQAPERGNQRTESIPAPAGSRGSQRTGTPVRIAPLAVRSEISPMASSQRRWRISGNLGCGTPIKHWKMTPCFSSFRKSWPNVAGRARLVGARRRSAEVVLRNAAAGSMYATGVTKYCRGKCAPIWSIASSPGSAVKRFRMTGRWETWRVSWGRR